MNLSFSTHWKTEGMPAHMAGEPTYFIEQINNCLAAHGICTIQNLAAYENAYSLKFGFNLREVDGMKLHTIRNDYSERWHAGIKIHFCINNRTKNRFQFAPIVEVQSTQKIEIKRLANTGEPLKDFVVYVDYVCMTPKQIEQIAKNDGFDSIDDFHAYFSKDFTGKIIHWVKDFKY